ncbi:MAG: hypothetical protein ACK53C_10805 [Pseudomonadota bacterium]
MNATAESVATPAVLRVGDGHGAALAALCARYGLELVPVSAGAPIPGSYWGEPEAGLVRERVYARDDTPVHSVLHEACHASCMGPGRRAALERDAGGDHAEENAVCCLQILLADALPGVGRARLMADMDAWGYTFRLGSTRAWFEAEADEARDWLRARGLCPRAADLAARAPLA